MSVYLYPRPCFDFPTPIESVIWYPPRLVAFVAVLYYCYTGQSLLQNKKTNKQTIENMFSPDSLRPCLMFIIAALFRTTLLFRLWYFPLRLPPSASVSSYTQASGLFLVIYPSLPPNSCTRSAFVSYLQCVFHWSFLFQYPRPSVASLTDPMSLLSCLVPSTTAVRTSAITFLRQLWFSHRLPGLPPQYSTAIKSEHVLNIFLTFS